MKSGRVAQGGRGRRLEVKAGALLLAAGVALAAGVPWPAGSGGAARAESPPVWKTARNGCGELTFAGARFIACHFDARKYRLRTWLADEKGEPFGWLWRLDEWLKRRGQRLLFAMNGGMYRPDYRPAGLYIEEGRELSRLNLRRGGGNFHLLPNGVFWIKGARAGVTESRRFAQAYKRGRLRPDFATQSGPMLVLGGRLHPRFRPRSDSLKIRNGVGVRRNGHDVYFAISLEPVNFHTFARLFRDALKTPDALFLDGTVSRLWWKEQRVRGLFNRRIGPIVGVAERIEVAE